MDASIDVSNAAWIAPSAELYGDVRLETGVSIWPQAVLRVGANSIVAGVPAKLIGTRNNYADNKLNAIAYHENAKAYARGNYRRWSEESYKALTETHKANLESESGQTPPPKT